MSLWECGWDDESVTEQTYTCADLWQAAWVGPVFSGKLSAKNWSDLRGFLIRFISGTGVSMQRCHPWTPWHNGRVESFNSWLRDGLLNCEVFDSVWEIRFMLEVAATTTTTIDHTVPFPTWPQSSAPLNGGPKTKCETYHRWTTKMVQTNVLLTTLWFWDLKKRQFKIFTIRPSLHIQLFS